MIGACFGDQRQQGTASYQAQIYSFQTYCNPCAFMRSRPRARVIRVTTSQLPGNTNETAQQDSTIQARLYASILCCWTYLRYRLTWFTSADESVHSEIRALSPTPP